MLHFSTNWTNILSLREFTYISARYVYRVPDWCHHLLYTARMFVKQTLEAYLDWYTDYKVHMVTREHRLVSLIHLLRGNQFTIYCFATQNTKIMLERQSWQSVDVHYFVSFAPQSSRRFLLLACQKATWNFIETLSFILFICLLVAQMTSYCLPPSMNLKSYQLTL